MKKSTHLLLIAVAIIFTASIHAQQWKTFSNDTILFTAKYPGNWTNKIKEDKRIYFTSPLDNDKDDFTENVNIGVSFNDEFGTVLKIDDLAPSVLSEVGKIISDLKKESQRKFKWNNTDAIEIIYTGHSDSYPKERVRFTQWLCFYKKRLYVATFSAVATVSKHNVTAKKIMESVVFK